jgi:F-type H+-transporting ATPase subunit a
MDVEATFPRAVFELGGVEIRDTVLVTLGLMALLASVAALVTRRLSDIPGPLQNALEATVEAIEGLVAQTTDEAPSRFVPFVGTLATFLVLANSVSILPGVGAPTRDVNTTLALAGIVLVSVHAFALRAEGGRYLRGYLEPHPVLLPFNVIGELSRTIALALRLFGNVLSGDLVVAVLLLLAGFLVPVPMQIFGLLIGLVQAYVFALLTMVYIAAALQGAAQKETSA